MPSQQHESQLKLFLNRPTLATELLQSALGKQLPLHTCVRTDSADLTDIQPAEYRADSVLHLTHGDASVMGVVVEVQLAPDEQKRFSWPAYAINLRSRIKRPVCVFVVAIDEAVARWAAQPVDLGDGNQYFPTVLGPSVIPQITDKTHADENPELAVLSAMAHGRDADTQQALRIAQAAMSACESLDEERRKLYGDLVDISVSETVRKELKAMKTAHYEFQGPFAKECVERGKAEGRAETVLRLLTLKFGTLSQEIPTQIRQASVDELDAIAERLLTAESLQQALKS